MRSNELTPSHLPDLDPAETQEWQDSLDGVVDHAGRDRARHLMLSVLQRASEREVGVPRLRGSDYVNTIGPTAEPAFPGDERIERRIRAYKVERRDHGAPRAAARDRGRRAAAIKSTSRATPPPGSTPARSWRAD